MKLNENQKVTLTIGQLKRLVKEAKNINAHFEQEWLDELEDPSHWPKYTKAVLTKVRLPSPEDLAKDGWDAVPQFYIRNNFCTQDDVLRHFALRLCNSSKLKKDYAEEFIKAGGLCYDKSYSTNPYRNVENVPLTKEEALEFYHNAKSYFDWEWTKRKDSRHTDGKVGIVFKGLRRKQRKDEVVKDNELDIAWPGPDTYKIVKALGGSDTSNFVAYTGSRWIKPIRWVEPNKSAVFMVYEDDTKKQWHGEFDRYYNTIHRPITYMDQRLMTIDLKNIRKAYWCDPNNPSYKEKTYNDWEREVSPSRV